MDPRPSPTPSEDNAANTRDISTYAAIDGAMSQEAQSYNEFLKGFSHLKKDNNALTTPSNIDSKPTHGESDFFKRINASKSKPKPKSPLDVLSSLPVTSDLEGQTNIDDTVNQSASAQRTVAQSGVAGSKGVSDTEEVEEMELGAGEACSRLAVGSGPQIGVDMKFDNFVELPAGDSDGDEDFASSYTASFCSNENKIREGVQKVQEMKDTVKPKTDLSWNNLDEADKPKEPNNKTDADIIKSLENSVTMLEVGNISNSETISGSLKHESKQLASETNVPNSNMADTRSGMGMTTDDLLMSFMADLQAELLGESGDSCTNKAKTQQLKTDVVATEDEHNKSATAAEDTDLIDKETYDVESTQIATEFKSEINKMVAKNKAEKDISDHKFQINSNGMAGIADSTAANEDMEDELIESNLEEAQVGNLVFPGEVENTQCEEGVKNERLLDFSVTYKDRTPSCDRDKEECSNEVEPFSLDAGFDYDNVVLAPKFSTQDFQCIQRTVAVQQVGM